MGSRPARTLWRLPLTLVAGSLLVLLGAACAEAQQTPSIQTPTIAATETAALQPAASGAQESTAAQPAASKAQDGDAKTEGIQVHGDWVLEVRNPDGSLAERREFRNALTAYGASVLEQALGRTATFGLWGLEVGADPLSASPWFQVGTSGPGIPAQIFEPTGAPFAASYVFANLVLSHPSTGGLRLTGTAIAQRDGQITYVSSMATRCAPTVTPASNCNILDSGGAFTYFSTRVLSTPVALAEGQQLVASLTITFS